MTVPFDPATLRPLIEPLSPAAILALHQVAADRPCWTCPIEAHGGLGSVWTLREHAGVVIESAITLPVEPAAILDAAEVVLRAKGYWPGGWNLTTIMGTRAWLTVDKREEGGGRESICYVQGACRPIEAALLTLREADVLPRAPKPEPQNRREEDEPTIS